MLADVFVIPKLVRDALHRALFQLSLLLFPPLMDLALNQQPLLTAVKEGMDPKTRLILQVYKRMVQESLT